MGCTPARSFAPSLSPHLCPRVGACGVLVCVSLCVFGAVPEHPYLRARSFTLSFGERGRVLFRAPLSFFPLLGIFPEGKEGTYIISPFFDVVRPLGLLFFHFLLPFGGAFGK
eukprot:RCo005178